MISYKPARSGSAHVVIPTVMSLAGLVAVTGAFNQHTFAPAVLQLVGVAILAGAVLIVNRFSAATYLYTVDEDTPDLLCVYRIAGKRKTPVISADLGSAISVRELTPDNSAKTPGSRRVNCCLNIFPKRRAAVLFDSDGSLSELLLEVDDEFLQTLIGRISAGS